MNDRKRVIAFVAALTMLSSTFTPIYADQIDIDLADLMEDTLVLGYSQAAEWCTWDEDNYVLTLHGQLPDTAYGNSIAEQAGVSASAVKTVVIEENTTAGASAECMFFNMTDLTEIEGLENLDTSSVTSMMAMFSGCRSLTSLDVNGFDTSSVTSMGAMFESCSSLTSLDLNGFDTSSVTDMGNMFSGCSSLT
ncbi:MAG: BspA family leucine-rich repeat surface protein, partial [Oscillospiraceae bacterium]|nr:BspA family leucine-rich repeat surface protein [Oscillospiraceae bacterium]